MVAGTNGQATQVYRARNSEASPFRYAIHPQDQFRITMEIEDRGEEIARSTTRTRRVPPDPSQTDINLADDWPEPLYLICSLAKEEHRRCGHGRFATGRSRKSTSLSTEADEAPAAPLACPRCARKYPLERALLRRLRDAARLRRPGRGEADHRDPRAGPQDQAAVHGRATRCRSASASNLAEAQLIQGILLEEGIPSFERRSRGFDVPDFLAAGPRDILVPEAGLEAAREVLAETPAGEQPGPQPEAATRTRPLMLLAGIVGAMAVAFGLAWLLLQLGS